MRLSDDGAVRLAELEDAHLRAAEEERRVEDERLRNEREQARQQADNNWRREERRRRRLLEEQNQPAGRGGMATAEQIALGQLFRNAVLIDVQIRPSQEDFRTAVNRVQVVSQQVLTPKGMAELSNLFREDRDLTQQYLATDDGADTAEYRYWTIKGWLDTRAGGDAVEARWVVRGNWLDGVFQRL